jgi:hypothetical protein
MKNQLLLGIDGHDMRMENVHNLKLYISVHFQAFKVKSKIL